LSCNVARTTRRTGQARQAGPGPLLGVVQDGVGGVSQAVAADRSLELAQAQRTEVVGRQLRPQVGAALTWLAHHRGEPVQRLVVEVLRSDHHALLAQARAVSRHRSGRDGRG
jgi:hypothetical protein